MEIGEDRSWETSNIKLLRTVNDNQLKFDRHVPKLCFDKEDQIFRLLKKKSTS